METKDPMIQKLQDEFHQKYPVLDFIEIDLNDLIFENRVHMNCFYCKNYNSNWRCPPKLPNMDYAKMFSEYDTGMFVRIRLPFTQSNFAEIRSASTVKLHKSLLEMEEWLWKHDKPLAISFIGGSCKLCKNGCGKDRCNNPSLSRTPLEATGVNVVSSARKYGIEITFPPKEELTRLGLLVW